MFILILISTVLARTVSWAFSYFGLSCFEQLIFHIKVPLEGTNKRFIADWFLLCFGYSLVISAAAFLLLKQAEVMCIVWCVICLFYAAGKVGLLSYMVHLFQKTDLYEKEYIEPTRDNLISPEKKMNLIHIYLESMETTYALKKDGGNAKENLLPNLSRLTRENISFSQHDKIGGGQVITGTGWTTGGMVAAEAGVPLNFPLNHPFCKDSVSFMPGLRGIGDILEEEGYSQTLLIGSDAVFGGRKFYYDQHGHTEIWDIKRIKKEGWLDPDYHVFWGYEDEKLFAFAKRRLTELSKQAQPFHFEMLTVDTHHPYGYQEDGWEQPFEQGISNSIVHTDFLLHDFMTWLKEQPFYEDTVIVIHGDHTSMAAQYIHKMYDGDFDRRTWNCYIHAQKKPNTTSFRDFSSVDHYPTILSAMGYTLPKNGLGLGRDLFSSEKTLIERYGSSVINRELKKQSRYYKKKILGL